MKTKPLHMPRVSIGLPVHNGDQYLEEAIESILVQRFEDFELIISDNASTDRTEEICRDYAARDRRIRYFRNEINIGAGRNFNRVLELSFGEYFKWAAHDDVCAPDFLSRCVEVLDREPSVVLCHPATLEIDDNGTVVTTHDNTQNINSTKAHERFRDFLIIPHHRCFEVFGLIRASALKIAPQMGNHAGADIVLLAGLALYGRFRQIPEYLFLRRRHVGLFQSDKLPVRHLRTLWFDPRKEGRLLFPVASQLLKFCTYINHAPLRWYERGLCYLHLRRWLRKSWRSLAQDLIIAGKQLGSR